MLLRILKNNRSAGVIFISVLMILLWLKSFLHPISSDEMASMPIYDLIFGFLGSRQLASVFVSLTYYIALLIILIRLNVIHYLLDDRSFMPATFFLLISASFPSVQHINPILVSSLFLILALLILLRGEEYRADPMALFNSTLLIAAGSLFYLKLIWFIPFLWITAIIIRPLKWRGVVNPILVLLMFGIFNTTYYWVLKNDFSLFFDILRENLNMSGNFTGFRQSEWILLGYLLVLILASSFYLLNRFQSKKIIIRKIYQVLFFLFIYSFLFYLFVSGYNTQVLSILSIPLAYLLTNYFHRKKTHWIHEILLWIWLLLIAYVQIGIELI